MLDAAPLDQIHSAAHGDPFSVLGLHTGADGLRTLCAFLPGAAQVDACSRCGQTVLATLAHRHPDGVFEGVVPADMPGDYRLRVL